MNRLEWLIEQLRFSRGYTENLLAETASADWFHMPGGMVTHVAWQVGHLAVAEYRLALERIRGRRSDDNDLIPDRILSAFGRGSIPEDNPAAYPTPEELRAVFDRVHERAMVELTDLSVEALDSPPEVPHRLCATKAESIAWCARHEAFHAGQIALLRRCLGASPLW